MEGPQSGFEISFPSARSLEELSDSLGPVSDDVADPIDDLTTSVLEGLGIRILGSVQLGAMTATVAVTDLADLVELRTVLPLGSPLPRILSTVGEEDIGAGSVEATLVNGCLLGLGVLILGDLAVEGIGAVLSEVVLVDDGAAHGVLFAHGLVPAVLRAVLEAPGASTAVDIDRRVSDRGSVVVDGVRSSLATILRQSIGDVLFALSLEWLEHVAQSSAVSVLDGTSGNVSVVGQPVVGSQVWDIGLSELLGDIVVLVAGFSQSSLLSDPVH